MELPETVEWALHCAWLIAQAKAGTTLPRRRLAEFFALPEPYLAKTLKQLVAGGILDSTPGAGGGYRLSKPAGQITVLEVVHAVGGDAGMFRCTEIRQNGPVGLTAAQCTRPCGIARVMHQAELAWRNELGATSIADLIQNAAAESAARAARWLGPMARSGIVGTASDSAVDPT